MRASVNLWITKDDHYGPYIIRVGNQPYGFADYHNPPWQPFTLMHFGPAGYCRSPLSATASLVTTIALVAVLILVGVKGRRSRHPRDAPPPEGKASPPQSS